MLIHRRPLAVLPVLALLSLAPGQSQDDPRQQWLAAEERSGGAKAILKAGLYEKWASPTKPRKSAPPSPADNDHIRNKAIEDGLRIGSRRHTYRQDR
jgi:hypothetical protein